MIFFGPLLMYLMVKPGIAAGLLIYQNFSDCFYRDTNKILFNIFVYFLVNIPVI